jgi:transposase-like protein
VYKHRYLIVKRTENLSKEDWADLVQMFAYLPELRPLWYFTQDVYRLFGTEQVIRLARRRRTLLLKDPRYKDVPELVKAMGLLEGEKFDKMVAFLECPGPAGQRVRTNNHVERSNRRLRYDEKVRYKFRTEASLDRFLRLRLGLLGQPQHCRRRSRPSPVQHQPASEAPANPGMYEPGRLLRCSVTAESRVWPRMRLP